MLRRDLTVILQPPVLAASNLSSWALVSPRALALNESQRLSLKVMGLDVPYAIWSAHVGLRERRRTAAPRF